MATNYILFHVQCSVGMQFYKFDIDTDTPIDLELDPPNPER